MLPGSEELWEGVKAAGLVVLNEFVPTHWDPDTKPHWHKVGACRVMAIPKISRLTPPALECTGRHRKEGAGAGSG